MVADMDLPITETIYTCIFVLFLIADAIVLYVSRNEDGMDHPYVKFHRKWGYAKTEILKLIGASALIYGLLVDRLKKGTLLLIMIVYCLIVLQFILEYRSFKRKTANDRPPA